MSDNSSTNDKIDRGSARPEQSERYNLVEWTGSFPTNATGYTVHEIRLDGETYFAARSSLGTWKVCREKDVNPCTPQVRVMLDGRNRALQLISLLEYMTERQMRFWQGPLARILGS